MISAISSILLLFHVAVCYSKTSVEVYEKCSIPIDPCNKTVQDGWKQDPDMFRNISQLISSKGYPVKEYTVQTKDGYSLGMQRIPYGRNDSSSGERRTPILLVHGLISTAADFVLNFPEQSLGFILADQGYDVWLGNTRGNTYSKKHIHFNPDDSGFWNFSFDELAKYDIPAMIDFILKTTGEHQLIYVGHSQGFTAAVALLSESPPYNHKIKFLVALSPVVYMGHTSSAVKYLGPLTSNFELATKIFGVNHFEPNKLLKKVGVEFICGAYAKFTCRNICLDVAFMFFGFDQRNFNETRQFVYSKHFPDDTSAKSIVHIGQLIKSKKFRKFDYGKQNKLVYNQDTPPEYDVSKITAPVAFFWGMNDKLCDEEDVKLLQNQLKSLVKSYRVPDPCWNHGDFLLSPNAQKLVYQPLIRLLKEKISD